MLVFHFPVNSRNFSNVLLLSVIPLSSTAWLALNNVECFHLALIFFLAVKYQKTTLIISPTFFSNKMFKSHVMDKFSSSENYKSIKEILVIFKRIFLIFFNKLKTFVPC